MGLKTNIRELVIDSIDILNGILVFINDHKANESITALVQSASNKLNETHLALWQYSINSTRNKVATSSAIKNFLALDVRFMVLIKNRIQSITNPKYTNEFNELMNFIDNNISASEQGISKILKKVKELVENYAINRNF